MSSRQIFQSKGRIQNAARHFMPHYTVSIIAPADSSAA